MRPRKDPGVPIARASLALLALVSMIPAAADAISVGDAAPAFDLPSLADEGRITAPGCFAEVPATVLMIWDRGCPHCLDLGLSSPALADSVEPLGARVLGIILGPDDPASLKDLLWDRGVLVPHLWDRDRTTAGPYDLGIKHIGIFVIDRSGAIRAHFDDQVNNLVATVAPAVLGVLGGESGTPGKDGQPQQPITAAARAASIGSPAGWPVLRLDARNRLASTERARAGDTGLFGEALENGTFLLYRWDLRLLWSLGPHLVVEPWLRVGNESETVLTEGAEQLSNRHGSLSIRFDERRLSATAGAFRLRLTPMSLQRWDLDDVPPIGGGSGGASACGCGGGATGLQQKSLEILGTDYTFEGAAAVAKTGIGRAQGWIAIPHWESRGGYPTGSTVWQSARYRRVVYGGSVDLGRPGSEERTFGLPAPLGLRAGVVWLEDDRRTLDTQGIAPPEEGDERVWFALGSLSLPQGIAADCEFVGKRSLIGNEKEGQGFRAGVRADRTLGSVRVRGRVHRFQTDPGFDPFYRAVTYDANRSGWRGLLGVALLPASGATRERLGLSLFVRETEERKPAPGAGESAPDWRTIGISLAVRPHPDLVTEAHWVQLRARDVDPAAEDQETAGFSLDLRYEGEGTIDPMLRLEAVRPEGGGREARTVWQAYGSIRIVK